MQYKIILILLFIIALSFSGYTQQPHYTQKYLVSYLDTVLFKPIVPKGNGLVRSFITANPEVWDTDDNNTTYIKSGTKALICIEGLYKNDKREGLFSFYLIDSFDHSKRYKIWEQDFINNQLNGKWKTFTLKGTIVRYQTFKNDSLNGVARDYWIDGKKIMDEREYFNGRNKFIIRKYYETGSVKQETMIENGILNGPAKEFYEDGKIMEEVYFKNGEYDKTRKYYFPNGQLWIEQEYKNGLRWNVIANYDEKGNKRNAGTLKNGNGTVILYNEDGTVSETLTYKNGIEQ